jgi:hypothetical protein
VPTRGNTSRVVASSCARFTSTRSLDLGRTSKERISDDFVSLLSAEDGEDTFQEKELRESVDVDAPAVMVNKVVFNALHLDLSAL